MKKIFLSVASVAMTALCGSAFAESVVDNVNVVQIGTYSSTGTHFVWFTDTTAECKAIAPPVHRFEETSPGGKSLMATLTTALVNNRKLYVRASGCSITEVYLK